MRCFHSNNQGDYLHLTVTKDQPLLEFLLENIKNSSKSKIKATLKGRGIKVSGKVITQFDYPLKAGSRVSISQTKKNDTFKNRFVKIIYEDQYLIVIEKNIGILSNTLGRKSLNVITILNDYLKKSHQKCSAHLVHRLDRDTSGLMVYAKTIETEKIFELNWHDIVYDRRYIAVLSGEVLQDEGTMKSWLKETNQFIIESSQQDNKGKYSITHFHTLARTTRHSLVEFKLETGRKNQIRVHASDMGHPVCGDVKYGNGDDPIHRLCLHAYVLCFYHPITKERMEFDTMIPIAFRKLFK